MVLQIARHRLDARDPAAAHQLIDNFLTSGGRPIAGMHLLRAQAYLQLNRVHMAMHALEAELAVDPASADAKQRLEQIVPRDPRSSSVPAERSWKTDLSREAISSCEGAAQRYTWRGVPMVKNCFDLALYPLLLHKAKPATIIEIGTFCGGSALWLADLARSFALDTHVYSIDPGGIPIIDDPRVTYLRGDGRNLAATFSREMITALPRPLMVIDDADHEHPTTSAILAFFHPIVRRGEYIVVEDGLSAPGVRKALDEFLKSHGNDYEIDRDLCDFFGYNVTWCVNGFLRRR